MAVTRSGPTGFGAVVLVAEELNIVIVGAPILGQHIKDEGAADWDQVEIHGHVTHTTAQVRVS